MDIDMIQQSVQGECVLVWEGIQRRKNFDKWKVAEIKTEHDAKRILSEKSLDHVWSAVQSFQTSRAQCETSTNVQKSKD